MAREESGKWTTGSPWVAPVAAWAGQRKAVPCAARAQLHRDVPGYGVEQCSGQIRVLNQTSTATSEEIKRS